MKRYRMISIKLEQLAAIRKTPDHPWEETVLAKIDELMQSAPSGSGIDCGTKLDQDASRQDRIVFIVEFHHMNESGFYTCWTSHQVVVTPSLSHGFRLRITGVNRNDIKDYLYDIYESWLNEEVTICVKR